ncbi:MAG: SpoIIE family protein phosphatase, partial [Bacteroidota bacterium]
VSGDFYWVHRTESGKIIFIVSDCTGHGVPGGFMSVIGDALLSQIIIEKKQHSPEKVLQMLDRAVNRALEQDSTKNKDGMDISMCVYDPRTSILECASAMNEIYLVPQSTGEVERIPADRLSIGGVHRKEVIFTKREIKIEEPTFVYLSSDGYRDQFGGVRNRKFMAKRFREMLPKIVKMPALKQKQHLGEQIYDWMEDGGEKQIDDMTVMGVKLG